ncbi:MAG: MotA/TolQ/ExbB proton channel family protein [Selenomonadaceae bacterium]|nr:MotA/TolQ/ExbB proton channel family protein [Selenomonadaceae bacterium]
MDGIAYGWHLFQSGGIVMYPLLLLSVITVTIAAERFSYYRQNRRDSRPFFAAVRAAASQGDFEKAARLCAERSTATGRIIGQGLKHSADEQAMKDAFEQRMTLEAAGFRRYLDYLSAIVTISPLLGLLGTVTGMIRTFSILDGGAGAAAITGGVGEALVATATGLCVAILAFCAYTYFDHQFDAIVNDTEALAIDVLQAKKENGRRA